MSGPGNLTRFQLELGYRTSEKQAVSIRQLCNVQIAMLRLPISNRVLALQHNMRVDFRQASVPAG